MTRTVRLCAFDALEQGAATRIDVEGLRIAVVRIGDDVMGIGDRCSHANFSLSDGFVDTERCMLECPKHGSSFSLTTGAPDSLPAIKAVPVYDIRRDGDSVVVELPEEGDAQGGAT